MFLGSFYSRRKSAMEHKSCPRSVELSSSTHISKTYDDIYQITISSHIESTIFIPADQLSCSTYEWMANHTNQNYFRNTQVRWTTRGWQENDPSNHVMTFHLWCSSNSLVDDSIRLSLFYPTLTRTVVKWYIELTRNTFKYFFIFIHGIFDTFSITYPLWDGHWNFDFT